MKIVLVTGGFDPIHSGHISYFKSAKELGDRLIVGLNSDEWLVRKKGRPFMPFEERAAVIRELSCVDEVIDFDDSDNTGSGAILKVLEDKLSKDVVIFANGGDRTNTTTPEYKMFGDRKDVQFTFGVGGEDKKNSSSWILKNWSQPTTERAWGRYTVLETDKGWATKKLEFDVGKSLSDQRHFIRSEHWHVVDGKIRMELEYPNGDKLVKVYNAGDSIDIPVLTWHKATNVGNRAARVIEVWMGSVLSEDDIERRD